MSLISGTIIKNFREDRQFSQKDIYHGLTSRTTSYRFESGQGHFKSTPFMQVLQRMGVTLVEYCQEYFLINTATQARIDLDARMQEAYGNKDYEALYQIAKTYQQMYQESKIDEFRQNFWLISIYGDFFQHGHITFSKPYIDEILHQIGQAEIWDTKTKALLAGLIPYAQWQDIAKMLPLMGRRLKHVITRPYPDYQEITYGYVLLLITIRALQLGNHQQVQQIFRLLLESDFSQESCVTRWVRRGCLLLANHYQSQEEKFLQQFEELLSELMILHQSSSVYLLQEVQTAYQHFREQPAT